MKKVYELTDLDCANCAAKMEQAVSEIEGVENVSISFMTQKMTITTDEASHKDIMKKVVKACKKIEPDCVINL